MGLYVLRQLLRAAVLCNVLLLVRSSFFGGSSDVETDEKGYVLFCPGMGGFDNQVEQFLGAVDFAKQLDRTLVLPNWIEYHDTDRDADQILFEKYFQVEVVKKHVKAITMEYFMKDIAKQIWPKGKRSVFCFTFRGDEESCQAKEGNPYGPYWKKFNIDFDKNIKFAPLSYDMDNEQNRDLWLEKYSGEKYPVLAFTSTPGDFPILKHNLDLQKHLQWSENIEKEANDFIKSFKKDSKDVFLGLHLKNGIDHYRACEHAEEIKYNNFFSSAQCLGYNREHGKMSNSLCYPTDHQILDQLTLALKKMQPKYIFVASEITDIVERFKEDFSDVKFVHLDYNDKKNPHLELAILGKADHAIVNCVSVSSAFVKRHRDVNSLPTEFWSFKIKKDSTDSTDSTEHKEL